jgi:hypothetical protein
METKNNDPAAMWTDDVEFGYAFSAGRASCCHEAGCTDCGGTGFLPATTRGTRSVGWFGCHAFAEAVGELADITAQLDFFGDQSQLSAASQAFVAELRNGGGARLEEILVRFRTLCADLSGMHGDAVRAERRLGAE